MVSPLYASLTFTNRQDTFVDLRCGWETACSQLRICIILSSMFIVYRGYQSVAEENKKHCETFLQVSPMCAFLLGTTGMFDLLAVLDSKNDNFGLCEDFLQSGLVSSTKQMGGGNSPQF